jgi:hypothetical protein
MPLVSRLFSDNSSLQACLVHDSAHLTPGSKGTPVELIQAALIRLRFLEPNDGLAEAGKYGPLTAAAVLTYKQTFNVINRSYQSVADNIVGRMTIALLDAHMCILDSFNGKVLPLTRDSHTRLFGGTPYIGSRAALTNAPIILTSAKVAGPGAGSGFSPPLSDFPDDMQKTIRRSNLAKVPGTPSMYPFVANHEGPLSDEDLSKRFGGLAADRGLLQELYNRMLPFGIWGLINTIRGTYWGTGARGMFCHPFDHAKAFAHMQALSVGPTRPTPGPKNPVLNDISKALTVMDSKFCKDGFNVHGERDSWREIVSSGPGLHICVTNASGRSRTDENYPASDFHIDEIQQGQFCSNGICIPLINGQTIGHLKTVGPWLVKQPGEWLKKILK